MAKAKDHGVDLYDVWEVFAHGLTAFAAVIWIMTTRTEGWSNSRFAAVEWIELASATIFGVAVGWWRGRRRRRQQKETAAWLARDARNGAPPPTERTFGLFVAKFTLFLVRFALGVVWVLFVASRLTEFENRVDGRPAEYFGFGDPVDPRLFQWVDTCCRNILFLAIARLSVAATRFRSRSDPPGFE